MHQYIRRILVGNDIWLIIVKNKVSSCKITNFLLLYKYTKFKGILLWTYKNRKKYYLRLII